MVARRKAPRRRAKKSFNISAIEAGTGVRYTLKHVETGNVKGALQTLESSVKSNKQVITATLAGAFIAKALTKGFTSGTLAKLGPIRIKA